MHAKSEAICPPVTSCGCFKNWMPAQVLSTLDRVSSSSKHEFWGCGSPVEKVSDHGRHIMSSSPVPLKTRHVGQRCALNLSRAHTSSSLCGVVVRRWWCQLRCRPRHLTMVQNYEVRDQMPSCS
ncbi:uncharacterized protein TNCV_1849881 [Trichonephila clavipes]|nr:uncharacterized protein TNCV_1849881 [Trichonephila clavipes]